MQYDENAEKYSYEGEMTPLKCDELKSCKGDVTIPVYGTIADADVYLKKDVDAAIAELKDRRELDVKTIEALKEENTRIKLSTEQILRNLLDGGLIKEWYFNGKFNAVLKADDPHLQIAELKAKLEDVQASMYCDVVDANMEVRRLRRALYKACANWAVWRASFLEYFHIKLNAAKWDRMRHRCLEKAEEYR